MKRLAIFVAGVAVGSLATWKLVKDKYEKLAQEEIDSVKERFSSKKKESESVNTAKTGNAITDGFKDGIENPQKELTDYASTLAREGYTQYSNISKSEPEINHERKDEQPYIISPGEAGELDGYEIISLTHYADGVLTDDDDEIIDDVDDIVGPDYVEHFGEYEEDSVYVRNDRLKCDYEILFDSRYYSDAHDTEYHEDFD